MRIFPRVEIAFARTGSDHVSTAECDFGVGFFAIEIEEIDYGADTCVFAEENDIGKRIIPCPWKFATCGVRVDVSGVIGIIVQIAFFVYEGCFGARLTICLEDSGDFLTGLGDAIGGVVEGAEIVKIIVVGGTVVIGMSDDFEDAG